MDVYGEIQELKQILNITKHFHVVMSCKHRSIEFEVKETIESHRKEICNIFGCCDPSQQ